VEPLDEIPRGDGEQTPERSVLAHWSVDEFLAHAAETSGGFLIPGFIRPMERALWVSSEGVGKSVWQVQMAVGAALGLHPFTGEAMEPVRTLLIDAENPNDELSDTITMVCQALGKPTSDWLWVVNEPEGLEVTVQTSLDDLVAEYVPQLIVAGPLYKLHGGAESDERDTRDLLTALDRIRAISGAAMSLEAHAPHAQLQAKVARRPAGSRLMIRWPEMGYYLRPIDDTNIILNIDPFRPARGRKHRTAIPAAIRHGELMPWEPCEKGREPKRVAASEGDNAQILRDIFETLGYGVWHTFGNLLTATVAYTDDGGMWGKQTLVNALGAIGAIQQDDKKGNPWKYSPTT